MRRIHLVTVRAILAFGLLAGFASHARAVTFTFFGGPDQSKLNLTQPGSAVTPLRNEFLSGLSSYGVEDLEDNGGQSNPLLTFPGTSLTATTGFSNGVNSMFAYSVSGTNFLWDTQGVDDWIQFSQPITAFGAYIVQGGDGPSASPTFAPPNELSFRLENTLLGTSKVFHIRDLGPDWPFYNVNFVGIADTEPFNKISFVESYDFDGVLWDDLIAGYRMPAPEASVWQATATQAVPEPNSLLLLASGLAAGVMAQLRRKRLGRS